MGKYSGDKWLNKLRKKKNYLASCVGCEVMKKNISKLPACLVFDEKIFLTMITFCSPSAYIFILYRGMKTYIRSRTIFAKLTFCEKFLLFLIRELKYIFGKLKVLKCTRCQICALWRSRLGNRLAWKKLWGSIRSVGTMFDRVFHSC